MMRTLFGMTVVMLVAACTGAPRDTATPDNGTSTNQTVVVSPSPDKPAPAPLVAPPTPAPASLTEAPAADDGPQAAATIVERYFALIEGGRYAQAFKLWEPEAAGVTRQQFERSFASYAEYHATVGPPGRVDAGAGQRYVTVPVRAYGTLKAGGAFTLEGPVVLHRTADIDGATPEQRSWRIRSVALKPIAKAAAPR